MRGFSASGNTKGLASSCRFSSYMPRPWTPTVPPKSYHFDFFVLASVTLKTSPTASIVLTMLTWLQGCAYPLWPIGFSVYASRFLLCSRLPQSKPHATLRRIRNTRYGWLVRPYELTSLESSRPGLSPRKKRQASLAALTFTSPACVVARLLRFLQKA